MSDLNYGRIYTDKKLQDEIVKLANAGVGLVKICEKVKYHNSGLVSDFLKENGFDVCGNKKRMIFEDREYSSFKELSNEFGLDSRTVAQRMRRGKSLKEALTAPLTPLFCSQH